MTLLNVYFPRCSGKRPTRSFAPNHTQKHIGLYPGDKAVAHFADCLTEYKTSKGTIQLPYDKPLPLQLIAEIARWCYETGNHP